MPRMNLNLCKSELASAIKTTLNQNQDDQRLTPVLVNIVHQYLRSATRAQLNSVLYELERSGIEVENYKMELAMRLARQAAPRGS